MNESPHTLVRALLAIEDFGAQKRFIEANAQGFSEEACRQLKTATDHYLDTNLERARAIGDLLLHLGEVASNDVACAIGLVVKANVHAAAGLGEYLQGIELYDRAAAIYCRLGRPADQARSLVGKVFALQSLGRHSEAAQLAAWASSVFEAHEDWLPLAKLTSNLGISYSHQGNDLKSLEMFDRARAYCLKLPFDENSFLPNAELNRSIALRDLGRYEESMTASQTARKLLLQTGRHVEAARALQSLATTYFVVGKYNEALAYLDQVKQEFLADGRVRDAMRVDLYMCDCLLQVHRHQEVLDKCEQSRKLFSARGFSAR
jgi:tetratricopeptide (TPR) repeat protein